MRLKSFVVGIITKGGWEIPARLPFPNSLTSSVMVLLITNIWQCLAERNSCTSSICLNSRIFSLKKAYDCLSLGRENPSGMGGNKITDSDFLDWVISWFSTTKAGTHLLDFILVPSFYLTLNSEEGTVLPCHVEVHDFAWCGAKQVNIF